MIRKFIRWIRRRRHEAGEIDPDEIFLDSHNLPQFDTQQFEGVIEKPIAKQAVLFLGILFVLVALVFGGRVLELQVVEGERFATQSKNNRLQQIPVFADRGVVYDRTGTELAWNVFEKGDETPSRAYVDASGLGHLLGYVKPPMKDASGFYYREQFIGLDGIEEAYNSTLNGNNGLKIVETNALQEVVSESVTKRPQDGENITLTVNARIQEKMYEYIEQTAEDHDFQGGAGIIMDVDTGELITLTSYPEYDPSVLSQGENKEEIASYNANEYKPFLNRAISGLYTPGSIVKPFMAVGALSEGVVRPETNIVSRGSISVQNPYNPDEETVFEDWKAHGPVNIKEAIAVSSNVYFYAVGGGHKDQEGIGIEKINEYTHMFELAAPTSLGIAQEPQGTIPNPSWKEETFDEQWYLGDTYHTAIGQYGFQVTPLQMVRGVSAIANGDTLVEPVIRKGAETMKKELPIDPDVLSVVREGMHMAVASEKGTAKGLNVGYMNVAAKTGTAEVGTQKQRVNSWVIGFFPYEDPQYAFAVVMERGPRKNTIGGLYVMRQLLDWLHIHMPDFIPPSP